MKRSAQIDLISRALLRGEPIDAVIASGSGIWRLSSIIHRRRCRGWPISAERARNHGLARYSLPRGWKPNAYCEPVDAPTESA